MNGIIERLSHWKSTSAGVAGMAATVVILKSFGCQLPSDWILWGTAAIPAVLGALSKG